MIKALLLPTEISVYVCPYLSSSEHNPSGKIISFLLSLSMCSTVPDIYEIEITFCQVNMTILEYF